MGLLKTILKFAAPMPRLESYQRYLFIGPHPDDIEIGCGATIAKLSKTKDIRFFIATDGRYGLVNAPQGMTPETIVPIRQKESLESAKKLGVNDVVFSTLSDSADYEFKDLEKAIAKVISDFQPDVVFAPDFYAKNECHPDHLNVGMAARNMCVFAPYKEIMQSIYSCNLVKVKAIAFYMTSCPNTYVKTSKKLVNQQIDAIFSSHKSQFPPEEKSIPTYLRLRSRIYGLKTFKGNAEGFRMLDQTHMHCFNEAE